MGRTLSWSRAFDEAFLARNGGMMSAPSLEPFALFCAYHLGLMPDGSVRHANVHDVARYFRVSTDDIRDALERWAMSPARMLEIDFDLAAAQLDLQASPPGVDLMGLAHMHWELFVSAAEKPRDWEAERLEDERINRATYGDRSRNSDG